MKTAHNLFDPISEKLVIASVIKYGENVFETFDEYIKPQDFHLPIHRYIYEIITKCIRQDGIKIPSLTNIILELQKINSNNKEIDIPKYIQALSLVDASLESTLPHCKKVAKFSLIRNLQGNLREAANNLNKIEETQTLTEIIAEAESGFTTFLNHIIDQEDIVNLLEDADSYINYILDNNVSHVGIPSGFPLWDRAIGGGLRKPGVHLVGARVKVGKSFMCLNVAHNVSSRGIPVLYLDTELTKAIIYGRYFALLSEIDIEEIESGLFKINPDKVKTLQESIKKLPKDFDYYNISGMNHHDWLSIARKWLIKNVSFNADGTAKDCLIILDYIKTMDLDDIKNGFQEYQYLGQVITDLHNFAVKYNLPVLAAAQLNREGISNDGQGAIAGSDRLLALCSSFSILRKKDAEDYAADPQTNGDRKLLVVDTRFGRGLEGGEYINIKSNLSLSKMEEGLTNIQNRRTGNNTAVNISGTSQIAI